LFATLSGDVGAIAVRVVVVVAFDFVDELCGFVRGRFGVGVTTTLGRSSSICVASSLFFSAFAGCFEFCQSATKQTTTETAQRSYFLLNR
jgi:hypothetical protein